MAATLKPYPVMKESSVPWLGKVPGALGGTTAKDPLLTVFALRCQYSGGFIYNKGHSFSPDHRHYGGWAT